MFAKRYLLERCYLAEHYWIHTLVFFGAIGVNKGHDKALIQLSASLSGFDHSFHRHERHFKTMIPKSSYRSLVALTTSLIVIASIPVCISSQEQTQKRTETSRTSLRAMSFNIRLGVAKDGENHWDKRKDFVVETIKNYDADFIGTQETWDFQAKYLAEKLDGYTYVGRSRQDDEKGEQCGILFRSSRFDKLIEGHFWLSKTPDKPGSKSWDSSLPRMATWLKLWDRVNEKSIYVINAHFDHRGKVARVESAKQIRKFIESLPTQVHVVVTGDFNAAQDSGPYRALFADDGDDVSPVVDTFRIANPTPADEEGTFNGFKGTTNGGRIDWIAATRSLKIESAQIDRTEFDNRYPSDHFPVTAELEFEKK